MQTGSDPGIWDKAATTYDDERATDGIYAACLNLTVAAVPRDGRVLEVGCGTGLATVQFRQVVGVDYSYHSLMMLRRKKAVPAVQANICALPFADRSFPFVLCANTLQHLVPEAQRSAAAELMRVASDTLVVTVHHYSRQKQQAGWIKAGKPGQAGIDYIYRFSRDELQELFPSATISALGFTEWPLVVQGITTKLAGPFLAKRGRGHILRAVVRLRP